MEKELQMITEYLDKVAGKIGIGAKTLWPYLIKQQYIEAVRSIIIFIMVVITSVIVTKTFLGYMSKIEGYDEDEKKFLCCAGIVMCWTLSIILMIYALIDFPRLINPEYYALIGILGQVK